MTKNQLLAVWGVLLALTAIEIGLAYQHLPLVLFLIVLLGLSIGKAALIIAWFMHLKFAPRSLAFGLFVPLAAFILCLFALLPDAWRLYELRGH